MTLIDTSSLIHLLRRKGDAVVKERVAQIFRRGDAATCEMVAVELWMGVATEQDGRDVAELAETLILLPTNAEVWALAQKLAGKCRAFGRPVPSSDVVIAACAFVHGAAIEAEDRYFDVLREARAALRTA